MPLIPSGLSPECPDVIGNPLLIQCMHGWGWSRNIDGCMKIIDDEALAMGRIAVVPEAYIDFTAPRCGITGRVVQVPAPYRFSRFVAFIMSEGLDYDFTANIAPCWRIILGDGQLDLESTWFPILRGEDAVFGYGSVGQGEDWLRRAGLLVNRLSENACAGPPVTRSELDSEGSDKAQPEAEGRSQ